MGLNYSYKESHKNYKQALYQMVKRARELNAEKLYLGITATLEKRRVGAQPIPKHIFVQIQDSFNMDILEMARVSDLAL